MKKLEELGVSPCPWFVDSDGNVGCDYICHAFKPNERRRRIVASPNLYFGQCGADARLIAAAPKMYDVAWELIAAFDERVMTPGHVEALRAALDEAAGKEVAND